jgi:hypothetical protein
MANLPRTFDEIEQELRPECTPEEVRMLDALASRDWDRYQDAVTELYMQKMFQAKIERAIRSPQGQGGRKPGSHAEGRHK